ncbi:MAG TPA: hypothetical protein VFA18_11280, partial [Gemmataceae bacterium]|nr:hypothetical protein [Gemmataceae bacterium]
MPKIAACCLVLASVLPVTAAETGAARVKVIAPFLDEQTFAVMHIDLSRVDVSAVMDRVQKITGLPQFVLAQPRRDLNGLAGGLKQAGARDLYVVVSLADLPLQPPLVVVPLLGDADTAAIQKLLKHEAVAVIHEAVVSGSEQALERVKRQKPMTIPGLAAGFAAEGDTAAQAVLIVSPDTRRVIREMQPTLPNMVGGGPSAVLTQGIRWAAVGVNWPPQGSVKLVIHSQNAQAARALDHWLTARLHDLGRLPQVAERFPNASKLAAAWKPKIEGDQLELTLDERALALLSPAV